VEWVVHRVIGFHLVDQSDLDSIADTEAPRDRAILRPSVAIDQLPDHVAGVRGAVDLGHEVFPLQAVAPSVAAV